jgi:hypothetical protein
MIQLHHLMEQYESEQLDGVPDQGPIIYRQLRFRPTKPQHQKSVA